MEAWKQGYIYIKSQDQLNLTLSTSYCYSYSENLRSKSKFKKYKEWDNCAIVAQKTHQESLGGWIWRRDSYNEWPLKGQFSWNLPGLRSRVLRLL